MLCMLLHNVIMFLPVCKNPILHCSGFKTFSAQGKPQGKPKPQGTIVCSYPCKIATATIAANHSVHDYSWIPGRFLKDVFGVQYLPLYMQYIERYNKLITHSLIIVQLCFTLIICGCIKIPGHTLTFLSKPHVEVPDIL